MSDILSIISISFSLSISENVTGSIYILREYFLEQERGE